MVLDNVQLKTAEERIKPDESLSANSIKFKEESLARTEEKVKQLLKELEEKVAISVSSGETEEEIQTKYMMDAVDIASLQKDIDIKKMELYNQQGPLELVSNRAIRLIKKMGEAAKANSKGIYKELEKTTEAEEKPIDINVETIARENEEPLKENIEEATSNEKSLEDSDIRDVFDEELGIDREEIERKINENIDRYLAETSSADQEKESEEIVSVENGTEPEIDITETEISEEPKEEVVAETEISEEPKEKVVAEIRIPRDRLPKETDEEYINYLAEFYSNKDEVKEEPKVVTIEDSEDNVNDEEYVPMTDEEIAKSRENIELDKYNQIYKEEAEKAYAVNSKNKFAEVNVSESPVVEEKKDEVIRDEVFVVPEREDIQEFTVVNEPVKGLSSLFFERVEEQPITSETRSSVVSSDEKDKLIDYSKLTFDELQEIISGKEKAIDELRQKDNSVDANIEEANRINEEITAEEAESEKKRDEIAAEEAESEKMRAELDAESEREAQELHRMMVERVKTLDSEEENLTATIQSKEEKVINITKDTESRREKISANNKDAEDRLERITTINQAAVARKEEIAKYKQMKAMLGEGQQEEAESENVITK